MPEVEHKRWYKSKTIWVNLIVAVALGVDYMLPGVAPLLAPEVYGAILAGVNIVLRVFTEKGIKGVR